MPRDDDSARLLAGRAGLVFAYVCFVVSIGTMAAAIYLLPLEFRVKLFLAGGTVLLASMFAFLAFAAFIALRASPPRGGGRPQRPEDGDRPGRPPDSSPK